MDVDVVARAGDRARAERQRIGFDARAGQALIVAAQRGDMRKKKVCNQHGLRGTEMRERRHQRLLRRRRLSRKRRDHCRDAALKTGNAAHEIEPEVERHLFVARAASMQAPARIADALDERALYEAVHVLIVAVDERRIGLAALTDVLERFFDLIRFRVRQYAGARQRAAPRDAAGHVFEKQTAIEPERLAEFEGGRIGLGVKTSRPESCHEVATGG